MQNPAEGTKRIAENFLPSAGAADEGITGATRPAVKFEGDIISLRSPRYPPDHAQKGLVKRRDRTFHVLLRAGLEHIGNFHRAR